MIAIVVDSAAAASRRGNGIDSWESAAARESLSVLGLPFSLHDLASDWSVPAVGVALVVDTPDDDAAAALLNWADGGGHLVACGGDPSWTGVGGDVVGEDLVVLGSGITSECVPRRVRAFGGHALRLPAGTDADATVEAEWASSGRPAIVRIPHGQGAVTVVGPDVWGAIVRITQGWPVEADGVAAKDGSAPMDDGILKCDEAIALSLDDDRILPEGATRFGETYEHVMPPSTSLPFFGVPHADLWREALLHILLSAAGPAAAFVYFWPDGSPAVGHVSHDSDANDDPSGNAALECFAALDLRVTWCFMYPGGYSPAIYTEALRAGHEPALHYNAMLDTPDCIWGFDKLTEQLRWARDQVGNAPIITNKNHYTRWEGWDDFFLWCEELGILVDQSHGPSVQGTIGFPFGTCHPHYPVAGAQLGNRLIDVLNLPLQTQDLYLTCTREVKDAFVAEALRRHGVVHLLFHGQHLQLREQVREALTEAVTTLRAAGVPFWTSAEIHAWQVARRQLRVSSAAVPGGLEITVESGMDVPGVALLIAVPDSLTDSSVNAGLVERFGRLFRQIVTDVPTGTSTITVELDQPVEVGNPSAR